MNKLCLTLAIFSLLAAAGGCGPRDATQTVVEVRLEQSLKDVVTSVQLQTFAVRADGEVLNVTDESIAPVTWPLRRTFTPSSKSASHHFRMMLTAFDAAEVPIANFGFEGDIVDDATRYVVVRFGDSCRADNCGALPCPATVDEEDLSNARQEAHCGGVSGDPPDAAATGGDADMTTTGVAPTGGTGGRAVGTIMSPGTAAVGGSGAQMGVDAGVVVSPPPPPSTDAECQNNPCGANGYCSLKADAANKYVCTCNTGYEPNEAANTCVVRNDCRKSNGGCEGPCETVPVTGEAKCSCQGNTWLGGDGKQCAEVQPEFELSAGAGSTQRMRPQVAFDAMGNGLVVWSETTDSSHALWSARYSADTKSWEKPTQVSPLTTNAADLHLALDASGSGLLVWTATVDGKRQLWAARYRDNAFTAYPTRIHPRTDDETVGDALMPAFALDSAGDGLLAWTDATYPNSSLRVARYAASSNTFNPMSTALGAPGDSLVLNTSVALHNMNSGLIAWTDVPVSTPDGGLSVEFTKSSAFNVNVGSGLGKGVGFGDSLAPSSSSPDVAMDAAGRGIGVWLQATDADGSSYKLQSGVYVPGAGWGTELPVTLAEGVSATTAPHIAMGADGSAFAVWREAIGSGTDAKSQARGALRIGTGYEPANDLGFESDTALWNDLDPMNWTVESTVTLFEQPQPHWDLAMGPNQTGFVVGAKFDTSSMPAQRQLWLQRVSSQQEPARPVRFTISDSVPNRPSPPRIGMNAKGEGAVVWDRQRDGKFYVYVSLLQ